MFVFGTCCPHGCMGRRCDSREGPPQRLGRAGEGGSPHQAFPVSPLGSGVQKWVGWGAGCPRPGRGPGALVSRPAAHCWFCPSWGRGAGDARIWTWDKPVCCCSLGRVLSTGSGVPRGQTELVLRNPPVALPSRKTSVTQQSSVGYVRLQREAAHLVWLHWHLRRAGRSRVIPVRMAVAPDA